MDFEEGLERFNRIATEKATRRLRRISMKALSLIVMGTPVLTGCCRGNWRVSIGELGHEYDEDLVDIGGGQTIKAGAATLTSAALGTDVFIENSCPYVMALENGWSRQKPPGSMIQEPLAKLQNAIKSGAE